MGDFFHDFLYVPIYNLVIFFVDVVPGGDVGIAVILATAVVKIVLMPLLLRASRTQKQMKLIEPQLRAIKEKYKDDKEKQAKEMLALYREHGIKPFSTIFGVLLQLPFIFALYLVFTREAADTVNTELLYSFVPTPEVMSPLFLGIFTVAGASISLALLAVLAQYLHARVSIQMPDVPPAAERTTAEEFGRMMAIQARFVLPVIIGVIAYISSGAVALYFITSSLVGLLQEAVARRMHKNIAPQVI